MKLTENFTREEFDCHDGTKVPDDLMDNCIRLAKNLQVLRDHVGKPIHINSGYRTESYNAKQPGSSSVSQHLKAKAADIVIQGMEPEKVREVIETLQNAGLMEQGGIGIYDTFTHYDIRGKRARWDFRTKK